jgi:hypothetical protein
MQPHCIDGEVVPEQQVVTASGEPLVERFLTFDVLADKLRATSSATLCLTVPITRLGSVSIPSAPNSSDQDSGLSFQDRVKPLPFLAGIPPLPV